MAATPTALVGGFIASLSVVSQSSSSRFHPTCIPAEIHRHSNTKTSLYCVPHPPLSISSRDQTSGSALCLSVGTCLIPHPNKVDKGGEDAYLVSSYEGGVIAVADGVSGWAEQNVDPSLFSRELMTKALSLLSVEKASYDPQMLLKEAHAATSSVGSATAIIAMLDREGILKIANVGDCGLRIIRNGKLVFSTSPQEHYFDCPYQLSSEVVGQTYLDAVVSTVELMEQDTIVMGSDGLFDNVFDQEIVSIVTRCSDVIETAKALCDLANQHSADPSFDSPYSVEARERGFDIPLWKKILGMKLTGMNYLILVTEHVKSVKCREEEQQGVFKEVETPCVIGDSSGAVGRELMRNPEDRVMILVHKAAIEDMDSKWHIRGSGAWKVC